MTHRSALFESIKTTMETWSAASTGSFVVFRTFQPRPSDPSHGDGQALPAMGIVIDLQWSCSDRRLAVRAMTHQLDQ